MILFEFLNDYKQTRKTTIVMALLMNPNCNNNTEMRGIEDLIFAPPALSDWQSIAALEKASYPEDEAASDEKIQYRIEEAGDYFYTLLTQEGDLIGFINGTCVDDITIHHDSMAHHVKGGRTLVIHSVVISAEYRRSKLATAMMSKYLSKLFEKNLCDLVLLLAKSYLLQFYIASGFKVIRLSPVVHGEVSATFDHIN
ncbi:GNAT family N-acetyltransferase [archaeon]|nr:MAG: GNAT family N-acetyltransferase [archaeon]